jgi:hypothetical protein
MNYRGSYKNLLRNSKAALIASVEIYNKPKIEYREECFTILLLNAWELLFKALLSKKRFSIFYKKRRSQPYKTLSWSDALNEAEKSFPPDINPLPVRRNLDLLSTYRDNSVHFYNENGFEVLIYALAQTSILNYKELLLKSFNIDLGSEINWSLLPLGSRTPIDPIDYISGRTDSGKKFGLAVKQFLLELKSAVEEVEKANIDTGRLLTVINVKLESTKKIEKADVFVGVKKSSDEPGVIAVVKTIDPNVTHPLRRKDVVSKIGQTLHGIKFSPYVFDAIAWKLGLKNDPRFCWRAKEGVLTRYSNDIVQKIKDLEKGDIANALQEYRKHRKGT